MAKKFAVDIDLDNIGRTINALDPINDQDYVTVNWIKSLIKRMTVAQATTLTTYGNITELVSPSLPIGNYKIEALIRVQTVAATTGHGIRLAAGTATLSNLLIKWDLAANTDLAPSYANPYTQRAVSDNIVSAAIGSANTDYMTVGQGFFTVTVAGTINLQFRSEVAGSAVTLGIGSNFILERLP